MNNYRLDLHDGYLWFDPGRDVYPELKTLSGRVIGKLWRLPMIHATIYGLNRLIGSSQPWSPAVHAWFQYYYDGYSTENWPELYPFQRDAIQFLANADRGTLLSLSPGLGKTAVSLIAAEVLHAKRVLIVAPLSLLTNWKREAMRWLDRDVPITYQADPETWCITNYDTIVHKLERYLQAWDVIIVDESILLKNRKAKRSEAVEALGMRTQRLWLLSGSPVSRHVDDLYEQFHLIRPDAFTSYWAFAERYCHVASTPWARRQVTGTRRDIDFRKEFEDLMFVRNQRDELPDLPELLHETIEVSLTTRQLSIYRRMHSEFVMQLESGEELNATNKMARLTRLQQIVSHPRNIDVDGEYDSGKLEVLRDLLQARELELPLIVWTHWRETGIAVAAMCTSLELKTGLVLGSSPDRDKSIQSFVNGTFDVLVLSLGVGKYGLTLTNTKSMVYYDRSFDADAYKQSLARVHRIGLEWKPVVVTLHAARTTDDLIEQNLRGKLRTISAISNDDLAAMLRGLGG